jgi:hypothetical protein
VPSGPWRATSHSSSNPASSQGADIGFVEEHAGDQPHLTVATPIGRGGHQLLNAVEQLEQGAAGEVAGDAPVAHRIHQGRLVEAFQQALQGTAEATPPLVIREAVHRDQSRPSR